MKIHVLTLIALLSLGLTGCATTQNAPQLSASDRTKYNLIHVIDGVGALQLAAENATTTMKSDGKPVLTLAVARRVVKFTVDTNKTIGESPNGWCPTVRVAYTGVLNQFSEDEKKSFGPYLTLFNGLLATVGCNSWIRN